MWEPKVSERFDLPHGTVFTMVCEAAFERRPGQVMRAEGKDWRVRSWDDHRQANGPWNGETIAVLCDPVTSLRKGRRFGKGLRS